MAALTAFELGFLVKKLDFLVGSRLDNIYQPNKKELFLKFYVRDKGSKTLIITPTNLYLSETTPKTPEKILNLCMILRKKIRGSRLENIRQLGFERVLEMTFSNNFKLVAEMFSKGNIILVDKDDKIIALAEVQVWSQRTLKPGFIYKASEPKPNIFELDDKRLRELLTKSDKQNLVKALAMDFGLGGVYAEKLCSLAGLDKNKKPSDIDDKDVKKLFEAVKELKSSKPSIETSSEYVAEKKPLMYEKEIETLRNIICEQERFIEESKKEIAENTHKAEFIYQNYQRLSELLERAKKIEVKELKSKLKEVKEVDPKEKSFIVEL